MIAGWRPNSFRAATGFGPRVRSVLLQRLGRSARIYSRGKFHSDPLWRDLIPFHEYFHGDNGAGIGASHQTDWTALVAKLIQQYGE
ncbi:MAG: hypothetical protein GEU77_02840 [Deltaproteobacteria bacterium]|nr:hypothetical protein [Deltaproteobacteria bacterium]